MIHVSFLCVLSRLLRDTRYINTRAKGWWRFESVVGLSKHARNFPERNRIVFESRYSPEARPRSIRRGGILLSRCINVTTLRGPSARARLPMAFRCLSAVYRGGNRCAPSPSPLRYACLILPPFLRGAANRLTHYFLHPFRSFTVNSCVKLIIHRWH